MSCTNGNASGAADAAARQQPCGELGRRCAGELPEVAVEVCLVEVPALEGDLSERFSVPGPQHVDGFAEPDDAGERLRPESDMLAEARREVPTASADLLRQRTDANRTVRLLDLVPGPDDLRRRPPRFSPRGRR